MSKKENLEKEKKIQELKKAREKAGIIAARTLGKASEQRDAEQENQTAKRYEKVGVSPIYSKGNFTVNSQEQEEKIGNRLTEDDNVQKLKKKKRK